jgi:hypothetical protein
LRKNLHFNIFLQIARQSIISFAADFGPSRSLYNAHTYIHINTNIFQYFISISTSLARRNMYFVFRSSVPIQHSQTIIASTQNLYLCCCMVFLLLSSKYSFLQNLTTDIFKIFDTISCNIYTHYILTCTFVRHLVLHVLTIELSVHTF